MADRASLAAFTYPDQVSVSYNGRPTVAQQRSVSGNFLATMQVRPHMGRLLSDNDDSDSAPAVAVLSHRFWAHALGSDHGVIGRTLIVNNKPHIVAGVLEPEFFGLFPGDNAEIYTPIHHAAWREERRGNKDRLTDDRNWGTQLIARLTPGVSVSQLRPAMDTVFRATWSRPPKDPSKAPRIRLDEGGQGLGGLSRAFRNPLFVLGGLVGLLLVIACVNIANLLLARAMARRKELAMRVSLGCSRARLMRQLLTESALLALLGGAASVAVAYGTGNLLGQFVAGRGSLPIVVAVDYRILSIVGSLTVITLVLFGVLPAWQGARLSDASWLKQGGGSIGNVHRRRWNTGRVLVIAQMAMSVILVMSAVIFTRNLLAIQTADPGFDRRNLVLFGVRPGTSGYDKTRLPQFYFNLEQRLAATPGVTAAGLASMRPMNIGGWWETVRLAGQTERYNATLNGVTPSYLPLYTPRMIAGRNITWSDINSDPKVAVISEDLARKLGGPSVLGQTLSFADVRPGAQPPGFRIVGIAPAFAATSMKERPYAVWMPLGKESPEATVLVRTSQPPQAVLAAISQTMREIDRNLPMVDVITMEEQISKGLQRERMFATLSGGFGILALALSVVGLYGVIAYSTSRRRSEIGVRLALGATPRNVLSMVLREGLALALIGMLLGLPVVWVGAKYIAKEVSELKAFEPVSILFAFGILLAAALVAVGVPALRASALHPSETLRQE